MKSLIKALKQAWHKYLVICRALFHRHDWEYLGSEDDLIWIHKSDGSPCYWRKFRCKKCGYEHKEFSW